MSIFTSAARTRAILAVALSGFSLAVMGSTVLSQDTNQSAPLLGSLTVDQVYTPVTPCRFVNGINAADRVSTAANGTTSRYYKVRGNTGSDFVSQGAAGTAPTGCGIPLTATAVVLNITVADPDADGDVKVDPADALAPSLTSTLNYTFGGARGKNLANAVTAKLCDLNASACASGATPTSPTRDLLVTFHSGGLPHTTYFLADVLGYFGPAVGAAGPAGPAGPTGPPGPNTILGQACPAGQFLSGFNGGGGLVCAPVAAVSTCRLLNGVNWCYNPNSCGESCNQVCASLGLPLTISNAAWLAAQNTAPLCQAINDAFSLGGVVSVIASGTGCIEDGGGLAAAHTAPGGLVGPLLCSGFASCPFNHRTGSDIFGVACGPMSLRSLCPCQ